jgi:hypothetical protein
MSPVFKTLLSSQSARNGGKVFCDLFYFIYIPRSMLIVYYSFFLINNKKVVVDVPPADVDADSFELLLAYIYRGTLDFDAIEVGQVLRLHNAGWLGFDLGLARKK